MAFYKLRVPPGGSQQQYHQHWKPKLFFMFIEASSEAITTEQHTCANVLPHTIEEDGSIVHRGKSRGHLHPFSHSSATEMALYMRF